MVKTKTISINDIRNMIINNLNPLDLRNDKGALWENFLIVGDSLPNYNLHQDEIKLVQGR